jgi:hypothetical protein
MNDTWHIMPSSGSAISQLDWAAKWLIRKRLGKWRVWKPFEETPFASFDRYPTREEILKAAWEL